jgi:hypothetical protein
LGNGIELRETKEEDKKEEMIIDIDVEEFLLYHMKIKFLLLDFIARSAADLNSDGFSNFDFKIITNNNYVIVYLLYDDNDSSILSWQVYLQEKVNFLAKQLKIDFSQEMYEGVLVLIEHRDLWK